MFHKSWDFYFHPPELNPYTKEQEDEALIASIRALRVCKPLIETFVNCRKMPLGKVVEPERCLESANAVIQCYENVKNVPDECKHFYGEIKKCLNQPNSMCEEKMKDYVKCDTVEKLFENSSGEANIYEKI